MYSCISGDYDELKILMRFSIATYLMAGAMLLMSTSCQQISRHTVTGEVVAMVGSTSLTSEEVSGVVPTYLEGVDSLDFADRYVDRWIKRQVKVVESERIFSTLVHEVELMVNTYRQALMTQRLDQYYINSSGALSISDEQIRDYYNANNDNFRLDRPIVKGRILRLPLSYGGTAKLKSLMGKNSKDSRLDLISISEKSSECELEELTDVWIDYDEFLGKLPIVRDSKSRQYMTRKGVQTLQDSEWSYLFEVTAYRSAGYIAPLERVEGVIRKILTSDLQTQMVRDREEQLYKAAAQQGIIYKKEERREAATTATTTEEEATTATEETEVGVTDTKDLDI